LGATRSMTKRTAAAAATHKNAKAKAAGEADRRPRRITWRGWSVNSGVFIA
jgi:hypothetical protein